MRLLERVGHHRRLRANRLTDEPAAALRKVRHELEPARKPFHLARVRVRVGVLGSGCLTLTLPASPSTWLGLGLGFGPGAQVAYP